MVNKQYKKLNKKKNVVNNVENISLFSWIVKCQFWMDGKLQKF